MSRPDIEGIREWTTIAARKKMPGHNTEVFRDLCALLDYVAELEEENSLLAEQNKALDDKLAEVEEQYQEANAANLTFGREAGND